jgi:hypothetical protein
MTATARREHGEGSVYRDAANGTWVGAISLGWRPDGSRIRRKVTGRTKTEVRDKLKKLQRLSRFRQDHPGVTIGAGNGWWQARIPEPNGEIVTTRYTLRALLDKLDELLGENRGDTPSRARS